MSTKVTYIITKTEIGGATRHVRDIVTFFSSKYDVTVISGPWNKNSWLYDQLLSTSAKFKPFKWLVSEVNLLKDLMFSVWLFFYCVKNRPQILHIHSSKVGIIARIVGRLAFVKKIIFTVHGVSFQKRYGLLRSRLYMTAEKIAYYFCDQIICVSEFDRAYFTKCIGDYRGITSVIPNEIPTVKVSRASRATDGKVVFGYLGRLAFPKNPLFLIEGFSRLAKEEDGICLRIKGDGPLFPGVVDAINKKGINSITELYQADDNVIEFLQEVDVLLLTSEFEGYPYVLLEGRAVGCYLVSSDVGGCREIIRNDHIGLLYKEGDYDSFVDAMKRAKNVASNTRRENYEPQKFSEFVEGIDALYKS